jgi:hypothetical protein
MKKKALSMIVAVAMILAILPIVTANTDITYIDENGVTQICASGTYTEYTGQTTLTSGWYVVSGTQISTSRINVTGNVHVILIDGSHLDLSSPLNINNSGIYVNAGSSLTIYAQSTDEATIGKLTVNNSSVGSSAIGGPSSEITINGGNITASGGNGTAGIGGRGSKIVINNGIVTSTGGTGAAGIGGGWSGSGGNITINGGTVFATGGFDAAGIGSGNFSQFADTTNADGGIITINGGMVTSVGRTGGAGIGGGNRADGGVITINSGTVTATGGSSGAGIGGGGNSIGGQFGGKGGVITINGGTVNATSGTNNFNSGAAGIGGGGAVSSVMNGESGIITIKDGTVTAQSLNRGPGIGGTAGIINISGGTIIANGGDSSLWGNSAGIGGGTGQVTNTDGIITITGGNITATAGRDYRLAIGWFEGYFGTVNILGLYDYWTNFTRTPPNIQTGTGIVPFGAVDFEYNAYIRLSRLGVPYLDENGDRQTRESGQYTPYTGQTTLTSGWYVVSGAQTPPSRLTINGDVHIIVTDGSHLNAINNGIRVESSTNRLSIYVQSIGANRGRLTAVATEIRNAGIGSDNWGAGGNITINGGLITAQGNDRAAGIGGGGGGGATSNSSSVTINNGTVIATGGNNGAGIGGGFEGAGGNIIIRNGIVTATGGNNGAGIGGGNGGAGGTINISGGTVESIAGSIGSPSAIGGGSGGTDGTVIINGIFDFITNTNRTNPEDVNRHTGTDDFSGAVLSINGRDINNHRYTKLTPHTCNAHNCNFPPCNLLCTLHVCSHPACNRFCILHNCTISPCNRPCLLHTCSDAACNRTCELHICSICNRTCNLHICLDPACDRACPNLPHVCTDPLCNRIITCGAHVCTICDITCDLHICLDPACNRTLHFPPADWTSGNSANCTTASTRIKICTFDGCDEIVETENQGAFGHDFPSAFTIELPVTCFADGEEKRTCQRVCGLLGHTQTQPITTRPPHTPPPTWTSGNPANCITASTRIKTCAVSGCNHTIDTDNQGALGHDFPIAWTIERPVTCFADGEEKRTCQRDCGLLGHTETQPITTRPPHTPPATWTSGNPANCITASTRIKTCTVSDCTHTVEYENQGALGHDFPTAWALERPATCSLDGEEKRACTRSCGLLGYTETRPTTKDGIFRINVVDIEGQKLIEIRNTSDKTVSTRGLYISDKAHCGDFKCDDCDIKNLFKWQMPSFIIRAGQSIIINDINNHTVSVPILKRAKVNFDVTSAEMLRLNTAVGKSLRCWSDTGECFC